MQSAHVAARSRTYLAAQYRRIATRRGKKRATMAVAHSILVIAYHVIGKREPYRVQTGEAVVCRYIILRKQAKQGFQKKFWGCCESLHSRWQWR